MWKAILPGEKVAVGDTIRYRPSASNLSFPGKIYQVVKTDQHYFEIATKPGTENADYPERKIIKYIDIGYNLGLEVWSEPATAL